MEPGGRNGRCAQSVTSPEPVLVTWGVTDGHLYSLSRYYYQGSTVHVIHLAIL